MLHAGKILDYTLDTGTGSQTITQNFPLLDLGHCKYLDVVIKITKADTDAADMADIYIDETFDGDFWDARMHSHQFTGDMSPSASAPEIRRYRIYAETVLDATEEGYETTGSAGAADLPAGTVRNGPFAPKRRTAAGWQVSHRLRVVVADGGVANADFEGTISVYAHSPV